MMSKHNFQTGNLFELKTVKKTELYIILFILSILFISCFAFSNIYYFFFYIDLSFILQSLFAAATN